MNHSASMKMENTKKYHLFLQHNDKVHVIKVRLHVHLWLNKINPFQSFFFLVFVVLIR